MASRVTEGRSLADAMALHPDVFNPDMVGTIRAGEMGGFLPDALQELAGSAMLAHHLSRGFMWITACVLIAIFTTPGVLAIIKGSLRSMELQDQAGGSLPTMTTLQNAVGAQLQWSLPMSIALVLLTLLLHRLWMHRRLRAVRHQMSLVVPLLSNRAKAEAARRFSFALGGITRAGVPPQTAYELASEAIPNDILRESMLRRLTTANESTKLSDLIRGSGILNYQYEHMIQNGELTGDVPGMLGSIATAEGANSETANVTAKRVLNVVAMFLFAIFIVIATGILYRFLYDGIFKVVLKDS